MSKPSQYIKRLNPAELSALQQLVQTGLYVQAQTKIKALLKHYPNELSLWNMLGFCQQAQGDYKSAITSFKTMLMVDNKIAEVYFNLGVLYSQINNTALAIEHYRKT
jgi:tetratricopeptide (TPR) repeat protein